MSQRINNKHVKFNFIKVRIEIKKKKFIFGIDSQLISFYYSSGKL
jgi:hypothetical protein